MADRVTRTLRNDWVSRRASLSGPALRSHPTRSSGGRLEARREIEEVDVPRRDVVLRADDDQLLLVREAFEEGAAVAEVARRRPDVRADRAREELVVGEVRLDELGGRRADPLDDVADVVA